MNHKSTILITLLCAAGVGTSIVASAELRTPVRHLQNPVHGKVQARPNLPMYLSLEDNTLGISVQVQRTVVQGAIQTEFQMIDIGPYGNTLYQPIAISKIELSLEGIPIALSPANGFFVAIAGDLIKKRNLLSILVIDSAGNHASSMASVLGL